MVIFTMLILQNHEHRISFHLLISSSNSFFKDLKFYHPSFSFGWYELPQDIKNNLKLLGRLSFSWFLSQSLSFVCRRATGFLSLLLFVCLFVLLILYPVTLLKMFISYRWSLVKLAMIWLLPSQFISPWFLPVVLLL